MVDENKIDGITESKLSKIISKYSLEFKVNETKWMRNSSIIPACEKMINDTFGFSIQMFNNDNFLFCVHKQTEGKMLPVLDQRYYQQVLDPVHQKNSFGSIETIERCIEHLVQEVRITQLEESLSDLILMSNKWGKEWFDSLTWSQVEKARNILSKKNK